MQAKCLISIVNSRSNDYEVTDSGMEPLAQPGRLTQAVEVMPPPLGLAAEMNQVLDAANSAAAPLQSRRFPELAKLLRRFAGLPPD